MRVNLIHFTLVFRGGNTVHMTLRMNLIHSKVRVNLIHFTLVFRGKKYCSHDSANEFNSL